MVRALPVTRHRPQSNSFVETIPNCLVLEMWKLWSGHWIIKRKAKHCPIRRNKWAVTRHLWFLILAYYALPNHRARFHICLPYCETHSKHTFSKKWIIQKHSRTTFFLLLRSAKIFETKGLYKPWGTIGCPQKGRFPHRGSFEFNNSGLSKDKLLGRNR